MEIDLIKDTIIVMTTAIAYLFVLWVVFIVWTTVRDTKEQNEIDRQWEEIHKKRDSNQNASN